jgi:hypothetical protein
MSTELCIQVEAENGVIRVSGIGGTEVHFLGSSILCGAVPGTKASTFYFYPQLGPGKKGLIAMARFMNSSNSHWISDFLEVRNENGKYIVDLSKPFLLTPKRIGQCKGESVETVIRGIRFSSYHNPGKGVYSVDGNTICGYLAGTLSADDVLHAAAEPKRELNYKHLWQRAEAERLQSMAAGLCLAELFAKREGELARAREQIRLANENIRQLAEAATGANRRSCWSRWFGHQSTPGCEH